MASIRMLYLVYFIFIIQFWNGYSANIKIGISHWNDISGQLEPFLEGTSNSSVAPTLCESEEDPTCIGGLVNIIHWIHDNSSLFEEHKVPQNNTVRLSSGNIIGGESGWLSSLTEGWLEYRKIVEDHFQPHAMALGMKEFGAGVKQTKQYIESTEPPHFKLPAILANTCDEKDNYNATEADLCNLLDKLKEIRVNATEDSVGYIIGVIGFVNPIVERLSLPGKLKFADIVTSIQAQINMKPYINTWIAMGDGNLATAKEILDKVSKVKLVIYGAGFSNTKIDPYPLRYNNGYIATAGRYGSSVGKLVIEVDTNTGDIKSAKGHLQVTTHIENGNQQSEDAKAMYSNLKDNIDNVKKDKVGDTRVRLEGGELCWRQECNLGNLVTDAMVHCASKIVPASVSKPIHSVWHGGAFFEDSVKAGASISKFDIHKWLPYHNTANLVSITGSNLRKVFEKSATGIDPEKAKEKDWRQFLQVSNGLEVYYHTKTDVPKLAQVRIVHDKDGIPKIGNMSDSETYYLVIPTFLKEGRGVYNFTVDFWKPVAFNGVPGSAFEFDDNCLENYTQALKHITIGFEERIWIDSEPDGPCPVPGSKPVCKECKGSNTAVTVILTIVFFAMFLAIVYVGYFFVYPRLMQTSRVEYPPNQL